MRTVPTEKQLESAYEELLHGHPHPPDLTRLVFLISWARFDPRLAEIWVEYLKTHWAKILPMEMRRLVLESPSPAACGVLLEFCEPQKDHALFKYWKKIITLALPKAENELFFIGLRQIGGAEMERDVIWATREYTRWGYLGRENLGGKARPLHLPKPLRYKILQDLLRSRPRISTRDYQNALGGNLSMRQLERDLNSAPFLKGQGSTRARFFKKSP